MRLQVNYRGAWKNTPRLINEDTPLDKLNCEYPSAKGLRIKDGDDVLWYWKPAQGWYRPHWFNREERHEL